MTVSVNDHNNIAFWGWGWDCTPPPSRGVNSYTCTTDSESLHSLFLVVKFHPHAQDRRLSATVSAPGQRRPEPGQQHRARSISDPSRHIDVTAPWSATYHGRPGDDGDE